MWEVNSDEISELRQENDPFKQLVEELSVSIKQTLLELKIIRSTVYRWNSRYQESGFKALEIGAREGGLSLWLAARGAQVVCSDLDGPSARVLEDAAAYALQDRIEICSADATALPWTDAFDLVICKSVLGGIARHGRRDLQALALVEMARALRPGGLLLVAENLSASPLHRLARRAFVPWGRRWRYTSADELRGDVRAAGLELVDESSFGFTAAFGRSEGQRRWLAGLDRRWLSLVPEGWRYVHALVARRPALRPSYPGRESAPGA